MAAVRPEAARTAFEAGKAAYKAAQWEEAVKQFTAAIDACDTFLEAHGWRGRAEAMLGHTTEALNDYTKVINKLKQRAQSEPPEF